MMKLVLCWGLVGLLSCSQAPPGATPNETRTDMASQNDLVTALEVEVGAGVVRFVLHLTNPTTQPLVLEFASAQRYDFEVRTPAGQTVWRWSTDQVFAQMLGQETIASGASRDYSATWQPGEHKGMFVAVGRVTASNRAIEQHATFENP